MSVQNPHPKLIWSALVVFALLRPGPPANAASYHVPSGPTPTLQDAIDAAVVSADPQETIFIDADLNVAGETTIPFGFNAGHKLLIRPGTALPRVGIRMLACCEPVISASGTSYVTLQDLDIFRHITNGNHIIAYSSCSYMLIQRCRIGCDWVTPGAQNYSAIYWVYPFSSMIRNCMTFATAPSTFQYGIDIVSHDDPGSRLWLYNNSIQGFYGAGIALSGTAGKILLRNNVAVTEESINPDPVGYYGNLGGGLLLRSSHNAVFCDPGDEWGGLDNIIGGNFAQLGFADIPTSFASWSWTPGSANPDFLGLTAAGPLHTAARFGQNLTGGIPDPDDQQVLDDWERDVRPSGAPPHTDRGADQSDADATSSIETAAGGDSFDLEVRPIPSRGPIELLLKVPEVSQETQIAIFDVSGRLVREVWRGETSGTRAISWDGSDLPAGIYLLCVRRGGETEVRRLVLTR